MSEEIIEARLDEIESTLERLMKFVIPSCRVCGAKVEDNDYMAISPGGYPTHFCSTSCQSEYGRFM